MTTLSRSQILSVLIVLAVAVTFGTVGIANATLTIGATSLTTDGAFTVTSVAGTDAVLFAANTTGVVTIGGTAQTGTMTLGSSSGTNIVNIAAGAGASTVNIANTQVAGAVNIGAGMTTGTITIGGTGLQTGTITIGGGTGAQTVAIGGGGTGVKTVTIAGGSAANVITIGNTQTGGSIAMGDAMTTGTITIGGTGLQTGTITFGGGTGAQTVNLGTGGTGIKTINLGTGDAANVITIGGSAGTVAIDSGDWDISTTGVMTGIGAITSNGAFTTTGEAILTGEVNLGAVSTFTDSDLTPDVSGAAYWNTNTTGATLTDFDGAGLSDGDILVVVSKGAIVYDVTSSGIKGGTTDITTAAGDVTTFVYDGTDWLVVARMDMSDDLN